MSSPTDVLESQPCPYTKQDDKESLNGVYDKDEVECLLVLYAIEDEHRLHGKVPGTGTIWRGYDHGD